MTCLCRSYAYKTGIFLYLFCLRLRIQAIFFLKSKWQQNNKTSFVIFPSTKLNQSGILVPSFIFCSSFFRGLSRPCIFCASLAVSNINYSSIVLKSKYLYSTLHPQRISRGSLRSLHPFPHTLHSSKSRELQAFLQD